MIVKISFPHIPAGKVSHCCINKVISCFEECLPRRADFFYNTMNTVGLPKVCNQHGFLMFHIPNFLGSLRKVSIRLFNVPVRVTFAYKSTLETLIQFANINRSQVHIHCFINFCSVLLNNSLEATNFHVTVILITRCCIFTRTDIISSIYY